MRGARLSHSLETGAVAFPDTGRIFVFRPRAGDDLSTLPRDRVTVVTGFRPDYDAFTAEGYETVAAAEGAAGAALVCLPRARAEARALIAEAAAHVSAGAPIFVDGQKTDGIDSIHRDLRERVEVSAPVSKSHGKIFSFSATDGFADWASTETEIEGGFVTRPGVFSADGPDRGSVLLAGLLPAKLPARVVDLGAGWGYLSHAILAREGVKRLDLVEAEATALACAQVNVTDPRAAFHWADASTFRPEGVVDTVVCNPPFHVSRAAEPDLGASFIRSAAAMLHPGGVLWLVANRHLPYGQVLSEAFREVQDVAGDGGYRVTRAARPARTRP